MKKRILITVKTYPTFSDKYEELVCTAGFTEAGEWIRIYPVPYRKLDFGSQYSKYAWVELDLVKNTEDPRPESWRPTNRDDIKIVGRIDTSNGLWTARKAIVLKEVHTSMATLIADAKNPDIATSLAVFKPKKVHDFIWEEEQEKEWDKEKLSILQQGNLFEEKGAEFKVVRKLPFKFKYVFESESGSIHKLMIEDWELGALFWKGLEKTQDGAKACEYVRAKYFDAFVKKHDLYFFLGTTKLWHFRAPNPFIIIGTFHPLADPQMTLL